MDALAHTFVSLLLAAAEPAKPTFEDALRQVVRGAQRRFQAIRGEKFELNPGPRTWYNARVWLPGATECRVEHRLDEYRCRWDSAATQPAAKYRETVAAVEAALGQGWTKTEQKSSTVFRREKEAEVQVVLKGGRVTVLVSAEGL